MTSHTSNSFGKLSALQSTSLDQRWTIIRPHGLQQFDNRATTTCVCVCVSSARCLGAGLVCLPQWSLVALLSSVIPPLHCIAAVWLWGFQRRALNFTHDSIAACATSPSRPCAMLRRYRSARGCDAVAGESPQLPQHADASPQSLTRRSAQTVAAARSTAGDCWVCSSTRPMSAWRNCAAASSTASRGTWGHSPASGSRCPWSAGSLPPGVLARLVVDHPGHQSLHQARHSVSAFQVTCTVKHTAADWYCNPQL